MDLRFPDSQHPFRAAGREAGRVAATFDPSTPVGQRALSIVRGCLYASALTPLVIDPTVVYPFVLPKAVFFRALVAVGMVPMVWIVTRTRAVMRRDRVFTALLIFLAVACLSAGFGLSPARSVYGYLNRMWGLLTWLHLALFYLLLSTALSDVDWRRYLNLTIAVGAVVTLIGLVEAHTYLIPWLPLGNAEGSPGYRPESTLGNPGYLSAYLLLVGALTIWRAAGTSSRRWRALLAVAIALEAWLFLLTRGRAALLGAAIAMLVVSGMSLVRGSRQRAAWGLLAMVPAVALVFTLSAPDLGVWRHVPGLDRVAQASLNDPRFPVWRSALSAAAERPLLGAGMDNTYQALAPVLRPEVYDFVDTRTVRFDRVHNEYLEVLVTTGAIGLVAFLAFWGLAVRGVFAGWWSGSFDARRDGLLVGAIVAYLVYLGFWFEDWASFPLALALVAFASRRIGDGPLLEPGKDVRRSRGWAAGMTFVAAVIVGAAVFQHGIAPLRSARMTATALRMETTTNERLRLLEAAIATGGGESSMTTLDLAEAAREAAPATRADSAAVAHAYATALASFDDAIGRDPRNDVLYAARAQLMGAALRLQPRADIYEASKRSARRAIQLAPTRLTNYHVLAELQLLGGEPADALRTLDEARAIRDDFALTDQLAARAQLQLDHPETALDLAMRSLQAPDLSDATELIPRILDGLVRADRPDLARRLAEAAQAHLASE